MLLLALLEEVLGRLDAAGEALIDVDVQPNGGSTRGQVAGGAR